MASRSAKLNPVRGEFEFDLNGKKLKGHASINSLRLLCVDHGKKLSDLEDLAQFDESGIMAEMIYWACVNYAYRNGDDFNMSKATFIALALDDLAEVVRVSQIVMDSMKTVGESLNAEEKK